MVKKKCLFGLLIIFCLLGQVIAENTIECNFKNSCDISAGEREFFRANGNFKDASGKVLSSNVQIDTTNSNYNEILCCKSNYGTIEATIEDAAQSCDASSVDLMYFTSNTNARVGFKEYDSSVSFSFNPAFYSKKLCVNIPNEFSTFDIIVSDNDAYTSVGYSCMYKISSLENGVVSDCDAQFDGTNQYPYTVWGRMWQNTQSLTCNSDCTSKLDGRVYVDCGQKIEACKLVAPECNGALLSSWVKYNNTAEVQCSAPWDNFRDKVFTETGLKVETETDTCSNLIKTKYTVMLDNELVSMNVYVCND